MGKEKFTKKIELARTIQITDINLDEQTCTYKNKENEEVADTLVNIFEKFQTPFTLTLKETTIEDVDDDYPDEDIDTEE